MKNLMRTCPSLLRGSVLAVICVWMAWAPGHADTTRELQNAVHRLKIWLGQSDRADGWRDYLDLNRLETLAAKGDQADTGKLYDALQKFSSGADGLDRPAFAEVRNALRAQLTRLSASQNSDVFFELQKAKSAYQPITVEQMAQARDRVVYDLQVLRRFYKSKISSRERAEVFWQLGLDKLVGELNSIEFELAPEVSVSKLNKQLSEMRDRVQDVEEELDQLPEPEEPAEEEETPAPDEEQEENAQNESGSDSSAEDETPMPDEEDGGDSQAPPFPDDETSVEEDFVGEVDLNAPEEESTDDDQPQESDEEREIRLRNEELIRKRTEIQNRLDKLRTKYDELEEQRDEVRREDADRQKLRAETFRNLVKRSSGFAEVNKVRNDPYFSSAFYSYSKFAFLYFLGTSDDLEAEYLEVLDKLESALNEIYDPRNRAAANELADAIGWLESTDLAPNLLSTIQRSYSNANVHLSISGNLLSDAIRRPVNDGRRVNELLFGRLVRGYACTNGEVNLQLIPDEDQVRLSLHLTGDVVSQTYLKSGSITALGGATAKIEARQNLALNVGGLLVGEAYGAANLASEFYGVDRNLQLIQRIARKQYEKDRIRNERESARRLEKQTMEGFREQASPMLADIKKRLRKALGNSSNLSGWLPELYANTSHNRIHVTGHRTVYRLTDRGRVFNLGALAPAQQSSVNADIAVQLHESMLSNYVDMFFTNRRFTNNELAEFAEEVSGEPTEGLRSGEDEDEWSITFARVRPIQFEFDDNALAVTVSGRRFSQGKTRISAGLKIRIPFKLKRIDGQLKLIRDGDATIDYADPDKKNAKIVAFKSFLETKLNSSGEKDNEDAEDEDADERLDEDAELEEFADDVSAAERDGILLPENLIPLKQLGDVAKQPIVKELRLVEVRMIDGWLYLGWNREPAGSFYSRASDTPGIWNEYSVGPSLPIYPPLAPAPNAATTSLPLSINSKSNENENLRQ